MTHIRFIIVSHKLEEKLYFYYYNFNIRMNLNVPIEILFDNIKISDNLITCQINSFVSIINCFFKEVFNNNNYIINFTSFSIESKDILFRKKSEISADDNINQIKSTKSSNNKYFFASACQVNLSLIVSLMIFLKMIHIME